MNFTEVEFLYFFPIIILIYWIAPRRAVVQNSILLLTSYVFYATWHWKLLSILFAGTVIDYVVGRYLGNSQSEKRRQLALAASLAFSLGALAFFKYENFFALQANAILEKLGLVPSVPMLQLILPLGISFYTLQRVGYILDVHWGRQSPCKSFLEFAVFCSFFPQQTAGPISRARELLPQLATPRRLIPQQLADGSLEFLTGFALKSWAANVIGEGLVDPVFGDPQAYTIASHWLGVFGYALQVFGDFAGYSLMAIGVARLFGIVLPDNFNFPFLSRSLPEVWRRWHITLNRWLFDFIFTPMTTSQSGWFRGRIDLALMTTFLASGFWHGANWTFVTWGFLHGIGMIANHHWNEFYKSLCRRDRSYVKKRQRRSYQFIAWLLTMTFFIITLVPFRAPDGGTALEFARGMLVEMGGRSVESGVSQIFAIAFIVGYHLLEIKPFDKIRSFFFELPAPARGIAYGLVIVFLMLMTPIGSGTFIYQQF